MKSWTFETTSTSSMKSFGNGKQGVHDSRVQFEVDRLSRRSLAMLRALADHLRSQKVPQKVNRVDYWVVSQQIFGCLTEIIDFRAAELKISPNLSGSRSAYASPVTSYIFKPIGPRVRIRPRNNRFCVSKDLFFAEVLI